MFSRRFLVRAARFALTAFLLAQGALAIAACDRGERSAARAVAYAAGSGEAPCHQSGAAASGAGLCVAHCLTDSQSFDKPALKVPAFAAVPALAFLALAPQTPLRAVVRAMPLPVAGPPPRILFRTLLI